MSIRRVANAEEAGRLAAELQQRNEANEAKVNHIWQQRPTFLNLSTSTGVTQTLVSGLDS